MQVAGQVRQLAQEPDQIWASGLAGVRSAMLFSAELFGYIRFHPGGKQMMPTSELKNIYTTYYKLRI